MATQHRIHFLVVLPLKTLTKSNKAEIPRLCFQNPREHCFKQVQHQQHHCLEALQPLQIPQNQMHRNKPLKEVCLLGSLNKKNSHNKPLKLQQVVCLEATLRLHCLVTLPILYLDKKNKEEVCLEIKQEILAFSQAMLKALVCLEDLRKPKNRKNKEIRFRKISNLKNLLNKDLNLL